MLSPPVLWFHVQTSGEGTDEVGGTGGQARHQERGRGLGFLKAHCPISVLKPHPNRKPCQRRGTKIQGRGGGWASKRSLYEDYDD